MNTTTKQFLKLIDKAIADEPALVALADERQLQRLAVLLKVNCTLEPALP
jgi:hypothetical protein